MTPSDIANAIRCVASADGEFEERPDTLVFFSYLEDQAAREQWDKVRVSPPFFISQVYIHDAETDTVFSSYAPIISGQKFRITILKRIVEGELHFLFAVSIQHNAESFQHFHSVQVADMGVDETFATHFARCQRWTTDTLDIYSPFEPLADPRKYVRDFSVSRVVPDDIRPWLLRASPSKEGEAFAAWRELATSRILSSLADQVSDAGSQLVFNFSGPPTQRISVDKRELTAASSALQGAAKWVFLEGKDVDTRHLLFANEIARSYRTGELASACSQGLESAQSAYSAYVKAGSRETLKALADLRKAVIEETQKISQKAQELAAGLWKDIPVAAAPFILKLFGDSAKISSSTVAGTLSLLAATFLFISYSMQVYINSRFFKHQDDSRVVWRQILCTTLSSEELHQLSDQPIEGCKKDYNRVRCFVGFIYFLLCAGLLYFGYIEIKESYSTTVQIQASEVKVDTK